MAEQVPIGLSELTLRFVACTHCRDQKELTQFLTPEWMPPRGWAGSLDPGTRSVVIVALNPGHPVEGELDCYSSVGLPVRAPHSPTRELVSPRQADAVTEYCTQTYRDQRRDRNSVFHRKSIGYARALLALQDGIDPGTKAALKHCWFTDLFKCSTPCENAPRISLAAFEACHRHIDAEITLLQPKVIVALGSRVATRLAAAYGAKVVPFRHPSNGCPRLDSEAHVPAFVRAAELLGASLDAASDRFRDVRTAIHRDLFS